MNNHYNLFNEKNFKKPLSTEEQNKYLELSKQGDTKAKELILEHNLRLVAFVVNHYYQDADEEIKKDLFSVGCLELWNTIEKFNINFKNEFSTYAIPSILGSIKRYIRSNNILHVSKKLKELSINIANFENEYENKHHKQLFVDDLSEIFGVSKENIILAKLSNQPVQSLQSPIYQSDGLEISLEETISDQNFVIHEILEKKELYNDLIKALNKLPKKQKLTLILLFGLDGKKRKQKDVAKILNITQSRVSKIKITALETLKRKLPRYIKEEYGKTYIISKQ